MAHIEIAFKETKEILTDIPTFHLAFNICALHFTDEKFFPKLYTLMEHYSIDPNQILFEVTERYLLDEHNEIFMKRMQELRNTGYSLAVDDYGTGHSSIRYLQHFPFNYLKIDKLFIRTIGTKAITETLNDAIIHLAKKINITIIAEGVETNEQVSYLLHNEVRYLQGWYFSKALSMQQLMDLLKGEKNE
ncbi:MAG: EAL domain-containing protein [Legionella sp.]